MTAKAVLKELKALGTEQTRKVLRRHGAREPFFGVKTGDMQTLRKKIKVDYQLALDLYATGNCDAIYLAGLIADDERMTLKDLRSWASKAYGSHADTTVPSVATGNKHGYKLALEWIEKTDEQVVTVGWSTLSSIVSVWDDGDLDLPALKKLLARVKKEIHKEKRNDVRWAMNNFVICVGCYITSLSELALKTAEAIGPVEVDWGETGCKTPDAPGYIRKVKKMKRIGKKRETAKC